MTEADREPWEKAADEVLDECADILGYSGFDGAEEAVNRMKERWKNTSSVIEMSEAEQATGGTVRCPLCGFEQTDYCVITDDGPAYACESSDCLVSTFLGSNRWNTGDDTDE